MCGARQHVVKILAAWGTSDTDASTFPLPAQSAFACSGFAGVVSIGDNDGDRNVFQDRVLSAAGDPIEGATLEFWQNAANELYSNVDPDQDDNNLRCRMRSDKDGHYRLSTVMPIPYEVPDDGPGGAYVRATGCHCWRPAHLHVLVHAEGYKDLVSELFNADDAYIEEDAVFGGRGTLAVPFDRVPSAEEKARYANVAEPFNMVDFYFVLQPAG